MTTRATAFLAAELVLVTEHSGQAWVLLIQRNKPPYDGLWAIPGGHVNEGEDFEPAARRELLEETGIQFDGPLEQVAVYGDPNRDPRGRYVTIAYVGMVDGMPFPTAGDDAGEAMWFPFASVLTGPDNVAFDHHQILTDAWIRIHQRDNA